MCATSQLRFSSANMKLASLLLLCTLHRVQPTEDHLTLTYEEFQSTLTRLYLAEPADRSQEFLDLVWRRVASLVPPSVLVPGSEVFRYDGYACSTETHIWPRVRTDVQWSSAPSRHKGRLLVYVTAPLKFTKPLTFEVALQQPGFVLHKTRVSHDFEGKTMIKVQLEIPDFTRERKSIDSQCLIYLKDIQVAKLGNEITLAKNLTPEQEKLVYLYYNGLTNDQFRRLFTLGLHKAMHSQLQKTTWICASDEFVKTYEKNKKSFEYSDAYSVYCG